MELKKDIIIASEDRTEIGVLWQNIDLENGEENDFEIEVDRVDWDPEKFDYNNLIYIPGTEFGGMLDGINNTSTNKTVRVHGTTWRGLLDQVIIEPPKGEDYLFLSGNVHNVIRGMINRSNLSTLFKVPSISASASVKNWKVDRYATLLEIINKLLKEQNLKLHMEFIQGTMMEQSFVEVTAIPVKNYSNEIEFSQDDSKLKLTVEDHRGGINHLICTGEGQGSGRTVLHLYVQKDGSIGKEKFFTGIHEKTATYKYNGADITELEKGGRKRLKEIKNYKEANIDVMEGNFDLGDIVSAYDPITAVSVSQVITRKITKIKNGIAKIEYKTGGE